MIYTGYGQVWDPGKRKLMVNFVETPEFETSDANQIAILDVCPNVTSKRDPKAKIDDPIEEVKEPEIKDESIEVIEEAKKPKRGRKKSGKKD